MGKNCAQWESTLEKKLWSGWPLEAEGVHFHRKMDALVITCVAPSGRRAPKFNLFPQPLRALDMYFKRKCDCKNVTTNIDYGQIQASKLFAACCGVNAAENIEFLEETAGAVPPRTNENKSECLEKECEREEAAPSVHFYFAFANEEYSAASHIRMQAMGRARAAISSRIMEQFISRERYRVREREREARHRARGSHL